MLGMLSLCDLNSRAVLTLSQKVVAFKSIAAYRSGLRIDPMVSAQEAENALQENLRKSMLCHMYRTIITFIYIMSRCSRVHMCFWVLFTTMHMMCIINLCDYCCFT